MKKGNILWGITISTIILVRISIIIFPEIDVKIANFVIHHFLFGVILIILSYFIPKHCNLKVWIMGLGIGLFIDQLVFVILGAGKDAQYWAFPSFAGALGLSLLIFPFREKIYLWLSKKY